MVGRECGKRRGAFQNKVSGNQHCSAKNTVICPCVFSATYYFLFSGRIVELICETRPVKRGSSAKRISRCQQQPRRPPISPGRRISGASLTAAGSRLNAASR